MPCHACLPCPHDIGPASPEAPPTTAPPPGQATLLLRVQDVCEQLQLSRAAVQRLLTSGELRSIKVGRSRRVRSIDLERFVDALTDEVTDAPYGRQR